MTAEPIKVLLVEDNPVDAILVRAYLTGGAEAPFVLEAVARLADALERLDRGGIAVVLLDLTLPDSDGLDTLQRVLARCMDAPVLILTGCDEEGLGVEAVRRGAQDYLCKGQFTARGLARAIRYGLERFRSAQELRRQEAHLRLLTQQLPAILWTTDSQLRFTSTLGAGLHRLALEPAEVVGKPLADFFKASDPGFPALSAHVRALEGSSVSFDLAWRGRTFQAQVEPLRQGNHQIVGTIGVALDVTDRRRVETEFRIAREIQEGLLPRSAPAVPGFELGGCSCPAEATGGDFFDYLSLPDGAVGVVIGDVSGHGFGPALLAAVTHACLRTLALAQQPMTLDTLMGTANRVLCDATREHFVTLLFVRLDPVRRALAYNNAGHPPGVVLDAAGEVKGWLNHGGLPLGLRPEEEYPEEAGPALGPGEVAFLFTDGVLETKSADGVCFGRERALALVRQHCHEGAQEAATAVCRAVVEFAHGAEQDDDITAVVLKAL